MRLRARALDSVAILALFRMRTWTPRASYANQGSEYPPITARLHSRRRQWEAADCSGLDLYPLASRACCHCSCGSLAGRVGCGRPEGLLSRSWLVVALEETRPFLSACLASVRRGSGFLALPERCSSCRDVRPREIRRESPRQSQIALLQSRPAVPRRTCAPAAAERQLRRAGGRRSARLFSRRAGVSLGGDPGAGRQRGAGQQEDPDYSPAPAAGHPQRRGAQ